MRQFPAKEFEEFARSVMAEHNMPGVAVSVVSGDDTIYTQGFGYRDKEAGLPVTPETIFGVASVTKSFSCLALMQLAEQGKLDLNDPVQKYIPGFDLPGGGGDAVTIHHFMTHSTGLAPLPYLDYSITANTMPDPKANGDEEDVLKVEDAAKSIPVNTYDELVEAIKTGTIPLLGKPGEYCSYSNDCYGLMGLIIEAASGEKYEDYMLKHVLAPLNMDRSNFPLEWLQGKDNVTTLYYKNDDKQMKRSTNWQVAPPFVPCGWLKSTVMDLAHYLSMHIGNGIYAGRMLLSPEGINAMRQGYQDYSRDRRYGYGFSCLPYHGVTVVEHSGGLKGVSSQIGFVPEEKIGAAVLSNVSGAPASKIMLGALNLMMGLSADTPRSVYAKEEWPKAELLARTGRFKSGEGGEVVITVQEGKLMAEVGKEQHEILRDSADYGSVTINGLDMEIRFFFTPDKKIWAIGWGGRIIGKSGDV